jgi:hypothetical protein
MLEAINIYIGYDPVEPVAYHVCADSIIRNASLPLRITPLALNTFAFGYDEKHKDGSNQFIYSRFLIPWLQSWHGWALFLDGDMILREGVDIADLWMQRDPYRAVQVVQHPEYCTKHKTKYRGAPNADYPLKNWSSVILWNCGSYPNRVLTPDYVQRAPGSHLHRFEWIRDRDRIGCLSSEWNRLVLEQDVRPTDKLLHYTIGTPCFKDYADCDHADEWHRAAAAAFSHQEA